MKNSSSVGPLHPEIVLKRVTRTLSTEGLELKAHSGHVVATWFRCLALLHASLSAASTESTGELRTLWSQSLAALQQDLEQAGSSDGAVVPGPLRVALAAARTIRQEGENAAFLLGVGYALGALRAGSHVHREAYARALGISPDALKWPADRINTPAGSFHQPAHLFPDNRLLRDQFEGAAERCFAWLEEIGSMLRSSDAAQLRQHITAINFEAGEHALPQDPGEVQLALRAGHAAWRRHPYLEIRFGERGRRFAASDSCWLVALLRSSDETATKSLRWLRGVLAVRGLPTLILATHLREIQRLVSAEMPEGRGIDLRYSRFLSEVDADYAAVDRDALEAVVRPFEHRLGQCSGTRVPGAAELVAAAWLDERVGMIRGALPAVKDWMVDPARFHQTWVSEVNGMVRVLDEELTVA